MENQFLAEEKLNSLSKETVVMLFLQQGENFRILSEQSETIHPLIQHIGNLIRVRYLGIPMELKREHKQFRRTVFFLTKLLYLLCKLCIVEVLLR